MGKQFRQDAVAAALIFPALGWVAYWVAGPDLWPLAWGLTAVGVGLSASYCAAWLIERKG